MGFRNWFSAGGGANKAENWLNDLHYNHPYSVYDKKNSDLIKSNEAGSVATLESIENAEKKLIQWKELAKRKETIDPKKFPNDNLLDSVIKRVDEEQKQAIENLSKKISSGTYFGSPELRDVSKRITKALEQNDNEALATISSEIEDVNVHHIPKIAKRALFNTIGKNIDLDQIQALDALKANVPYQNMLKAHKACGEMLTDPQWVSKNADKLGSPDVAERITVLKEAQDELTEEVTEINGEISVLNKNQNRTDDEERKLALYCKIRDQINETMNGDPANPEELGINQQMLRFVSAGKELKDKSGFAELSPTIQEYLKVSAELAEKMRISYEETTNEGRTVGDRGKQAAYIAQRNHLEKLEEEFLGAADKMGELAKTQEPQTKAPKEKSEADEAAAKFAEAGATGATEGKPTTATPHGKKPAGKGGRGGGS